MRYLLASMILLPFISMAEAQVGPAPARVITKPMPLKAPSAQTFNADAELLINKKGRVDFVNIIESSGDPGFDKEWKKSLSDWRFIPAVGADNEPVSSSARATYKSTGGLGIRTFIPGTTDESAGPNVVGESARFEKLTCKDFLWEYYIVTNTLPRRLALLDSLLKTPLVMFNAEAQLEPARQQALRDRYDDIVTDAAKQCHDNTESVFYSGILKPMLQAAITN